MAKLMKFGNSHGLLLPKVVLDAAGLRVRDDLAVRLLDNGSILLTPRKGPVAVAGDQIVKMAPKRQPAKEQTITGKW